MLAGLVLSTGINIYLFTHIKAEPMAGLHNSESSKGQIININLPWATEVYFI